MLQEELRNVLGKNDEDAHLHRDYRQLDDLFYETPVLSFPEIEVLSLFNTNDARKFSFGFQGIRRLLNIHQQTLTVALRRLVRKGIIAKNDDREYFLTEQGGNIISDLFSTIGNKTSCDCDSSQNCLLSYRIVIKLDSQRIDHSELVKRLKGKWFSHFRYVGSFQGRGESAVEWITDDASYTARVGVDKNGTIAVTVSTLKFCDEDQLRQETQKVSSFIEKNIKEFFGVSPVFQSKTECTRSKPCLNLSSLDKWVEEIYQSQMRRNYS